MARGALKTRRNDGNPGGSALETVVVAAAVIAALYLGRAIAIPIAIAVLISFSLGPPVGWLRRHRFGRLPAILAVVLPALLAILAFAYVVTTEVGRLAGNIRLISKPRSAVSRMHCRPAPCWIRALPSCAN
jgi:predicted PurR-regulated permease PerM